MDTDIPCICQPAALAAKALSSLKHGIDIGRNYAAINVPQS
jgi:hypothetical protein